MKKVQLSFALVPIQLLVFTATAAAQLTHVPAVTGRPLAEAQRILADNRLNAQVTQQPVAEPKLDGVVIAQKITEGTRTMRGATVPLIVGKYTALTRGSLPSVVGMNIAQAREMLEKQGWKVDVRRETTNDASKKDVVLSQAPRAGSQAVPQQTTVLLRVGFQVPQPQGKGGTLKQSTPSSEVIMPDTIGKTLADAQYALTSRGITPNRIVVRERVVRDPRFSAGIVQSQKPVAGEKVPYHPTAFPVELWVDIYKR